MSRNQKLTLRQAIKNRDGNICRTCKRDKNLTVHHIIPRSAKGKDVPRNLITLCRKCHDVVHDMYRSGLLTPAAMREWAKDLLETEVDMYG